MELPAWMQLHRNCLFSMPVLLQLFCPVFCTYLVGRLPGVPVYRSIMEGRQQTQGKRQQGLNLQIYKSLFCNNSEVFLLFYCPVLCGKVVGSYINRKIYFGYLKKKILWYVNKLIKLIYLQNKANNISFAWLSRITQLRNTQHINKCIN